MNDGKPEKRFKQEHYDLLMDCVKKEDMTEWKRWYMEYLRGGLPEKRGAWLEGAYLGQANLKGAYLRQANLKGANLREANLERANLREANLEGAYLDKANLEGITLEESRLKGAQLYKVNLKGAYLNWTNLEEAYLNDAILEDASLYGVNLKGADLRSVHLERAHLYEVNLEEADLDDAHLERTYLGKANLKGANLGYAHLEKTDLTWANLEKANLSYAHLEGATLVETQLGGAKLQGSNLEGATLRWPRLNDADLSYAHLRGTNLSYAHLERTNLQKSHLEGVNLQGSHLEGASFYASWLDEKTDLLDCTYDTKTDFTATALTSTRVEPDTLTKLQCNIRRKQWEQWYIKPRVYPFVESLPSIWKKIRGATPRDTAKVNSPRSTEGITYFTWRDRLKSVFIDLPTETFWWISDYGQNTQRILVTFFGLNMLFALIYMVLSSFTPHIIPNTVPFFNETDSFLMVLIQSNMIVFSITDVATRDLDEITMFVVLIHIILGYVLLAALVTRFAIMFQSVGR